MWWYLRTRFTLWLLRLACRVIRWAALAAVLIAAAPVTLVAGLGFAGAWLRGWPPARLRRAAIWALPMTGVYLAGCGLRAATWRAFVLAPVRDWQAAWHQGWAGHVVTAFALTAPVAVPAGLAAAARLRAWRVYAIETGLAGRTATAPVVFDARQWRRACRGARGRVTAPGAFPLATSRGRVVMGATIRAVGHRWRPATAVPYTAMGRHQVIIGSSGCGKTNLMMRTWAGWYAAALAVHYRYRKARPLLVVLDCKGGPDARVKAERTRRLLHAAGARRVAIWPDEATISLWDLPPADLAVTLFQLIESGKGPAAYYADVTQAEITLAVTAPPRLARRPARRSSWADWTPAGWRPPGRATLRGWAAWPPPAAPWPMSACATAPCCRGSARPWTVPAPWPVPAPGTSFWKAPASSPWRRPRPWP
jgi:hypothetical protein